MRNFILQILRIAPTTDRFLRLVHARISWIFIWIAVYLLTLGPYATGHHFGWINLIPLFLWVIAWTISGLHPRALAALVAIRLPGNPGKRKMETVKQTLADILPKVFGEIGIWLIILFFYLAIIDASLKPSVIWFIYAAALIYAFYTIRYNKDARFFKRLSVTVAIIIIVTSLISLMKPKNQEHYFGSHVSASLKASPWDEQITGEEAKAEELQQGWEYLEWQKLIAKMRIAKLTDKEIERLAELKEKRSARTIPGWIWGKTKSVFYGIKSLWPQKVVLAEQTPAKITAPPPQVTVTVAQVQTAQPIIPSSPSNKYKLCWDKPPGYQGRNPDDRHRCFDTEIDLVGESLQIKLHFRHQQEWQVAKFIGFKTDSDTYEGE